MVEAVPCVVEMRLMDSGVDAGTEDPSEHAFHSETAISFAAHTYSAGLRAALHKWEHLEGK